MARLSTIALGALLVVACGRTRLHGAQNGLAPLSMADGGLQCVANGDCDDTEVCLDNACVFFGECLRDWHCPTTGGCVDNQCRGELPPFEESEPVACQINADCPDRHYCVNESCRLGVECLVHAHCDPGKACVGRICVDAL